MPTRAFYGRLAIILALLIPSLTQGQTQAPSIATGVTFQWVGTQANNSAAAVLQSITINGNVYDNLLVPSAYDMTVPGPTQGSNQIKENGTFIYSNSNTAGWDAAALAAFQSFNMNYYFTSSANGANFCNNFGAVATTTAQQQTLTYSPGVPSTTEAIVAISERNANNCYYIQLSGTPAGGGADAVLGGTFVRQNTTQNGNTPAPPPAGVDYWNSGRVNDNGGSIGIALFYLSDIAPLGSIVKEVTLFGATSDHGDGKIFLATSKVDLGIDKSIDDATPVIGDNITFTIAASNSSAAGISSEPAAEVSDLLPSGYTYVSHTTTQGTYDNTTGVWTIGALAPGDTDSLFIVATVNPTGNYTNSANIAGTYIESNTTDNNSSATAVPTAPAPTVNPDPDVNVGYVDVPLTGDLSTNDNVPAGTTYGTNPTPDPNNPNQTDVPVIDPSTGTYTFTGTDPGVYTFNVEVCEPGQLSPCPTETLVITVTDPTDPINDPVANIDQTSVTYGSTTGVNIDVTDNDAPGNTDGSLGLPTPGGLQPSNGTLNYDPATGIFNYVPDPTFSGLDTFSYVICDTVPAVPLCDTSIVIVEVPGPGENGLTASDDFASTPPGVPVTNNALDNDTDPEGDALTVTAVTTPDSIPGGTYTIDATGEYTFTPHPGFSGSTNFTYEVCDANGLCEEATVYITVPPAPDATPDINGSFVDMPVSGNVATNDNDILPGTTYGSTPTPEPGNPTTDLPVIDPATGDYTFTGTAPGVYQFNVEVCSPNQISPCPTELLTITVLDSTSTSNPPVANVDLGSTPENTPVTVNITGNDLPASQNGALQVVPTIASGGGPSNGTAVFNADGELVYTPNSGFVGTDTVHYEICDTVPDPDLCTSSMAIIEVLPTGENDIVASDDFSIGLQGQPIVDSALGNDSDPNGDDFSVTPQTNVSIPGVGVFSIDADGHYVFVPDPTFVGPVNFPYEICDVNGLCTQATIYMLITNENLLQASLSETDLKAVYHDCKVYLDWIIEDAENVDMVELERGSDIQNFITLNRYYPNSENGVPVKESYVDANLEGAISYYYRLKGIDVEGKVTYSSIKRILNVCDEDGRSIDIYPNPNAGLFNLELIGFDNKLISIEVRDILGRAISKMEIDVDNEIITKEFDLTNLEGGHYYMNISTGDGYLEQKIFMIK